MTARGSTLRRNNLIHLVRVGIILLLWPGLLAGVHSFRSIISIPTTTLRKSINILSSDSRFDLQRDSQQQNKIRSGLYQQQQNRRQSSLVILNASDDDSNDSGSGILESIGLVSQPIVWVSLYSLATTGHGLPAGPGGSIGAVEGLAYLVVLVMALLPATNDQEPPSLAKTVSRVSIVLGLVVLVGVAAGKGCVPNAKPILDYSSYLPVCGPE